MQEEENRPQEMPAESPERSEPAGDSVAQGDSAAQESAESPEVTDEEVADSLGRMLEEAERRGYLRARNEIARAAMKKPRLWENRRRTEAETAAGASASASASADAAAASADSLSSDFLTRIRPSVWD